MQKPEPRQHVAPGESKLHFLDYWRVVRVRFGIVLLSFLLVVITAGVTTYFQPRKYRASVDAGIAFGRPIQGLQPGPERGHGRD